MNIWDVLLIAGIALAVAYAVYRIVKAKKSGKTCSCGCEGCANTNCKGRTRLF